MRNKLTSNEQEILGAHERFFVSGVSINTHRIFCGDERKPLLAGVFIHVFGGAANTAFNTQILAQATKKGSRLATFMQAASETAKALVSHGIAAGVHSDTHSETSNEINPESTAPIGCGYIKLRRAISQTIAANPDAIVRLAESLCPEFFTDPADTTFAHSIVKSHMQLAASDAFFTHSSREVATAALREGAPGMLVNGDHTATLGIINLQRGTTIDSGTAFNDNKSIYVHDAWASRAMAEHYDAAQAFTDKEWHIADLIDAIGTMQALGVTEIAVRR
jgi:hypothetical protein